MDIPSSRRLSFRLLDLEQDADSELIFQLDQDPLVMKYINGGKPSTPELHRKLKARVAKFRNPERGWGLWGVFESGEMFVGWVLVRPIGFFTEAPCWENLEIGWRFRAQSWGQGYATEAASAVVDTFRKRDEVEFFSAFADPKNLASVRIMEKLGLELETRMPDMEPGYTDGAVYYCRAAKALS